MTKARIWINVTRRFGNKAIAEAELLSTAESHIWVMMDGHRRKFNRERNIWGDYVPRPHYIRGRQLKTTSTNLEVIDLDDEPVRSELVP